MIKIKLVIILLMFPIFSYGQLIDEVELVVNHSRRIPNHEVAVKITSYQNKPVTVTVKSTPMNNDRNWYHTRIDTTYTISKDEYANLLNLVSQIQSADIIKAMNGGGNDGSMWKLTFGDYTNMISYQVWTIGNRTSERGLDRFKAACEYLLSLGKFEYSQIK